jgi:two-component system sensor histidine kinase VicK
VIIQGTENVIKSALQGLYKIRERFDSCFDKIGPSVIVTIEPLWKELIELKKREVKIRLLTEITKDNIPYCKGFMDIGELRHFDGVKVNFAILDDKEYQATIIHEETEPVTQLIVSNPKSFVDQHQYVFDTLWSRSIPGEQKIKQIEEGVRPDFVDVIHDSKKGRVVLIVQLHLCVNNYDTFVRKCPMIQIISNFIICVTNSYSKYIDPHER